jgi:hypothetical protein
MVAGCSSIGPVRLENDQLDYSRTLAEVGKRQTMFNLVRLRYGDAPSFVSVQQMVAGYSLQSTVQAGVQAYVSSGSSNYGTALGTVQYTDRPTFTFSPLTGERFVQAYLRPLSPAEVVPLIQGGVPIDVLLRLVAHAIGPLQNAGVLGGPNRSGSPQLPQLLEDLRTLQEAGVLRLRSQREKEGVRVFLRFDIRLTPTMEALVARVCQLLEVDRGRELEKLPVPEEDVQNGQTRATLRGPGNGRPIIVVHMGPSRPAASYVAARIDDKWFWVERTDFASKLAFDIIELLKYIAESPSGIPPPALTISTN